MIDQKVDYSLNAVYVQALRAFTELEKVVKGNPEIEKLVLALGSIPVCVSISPEGKRTWIPVKDLGYEERLLVTKGTDE